MMLGEWLMYWKQQFDMGHKPDTIPGANDATEFHGVIHDLEDEDGLKYALIGYNLPSGCHAEIDDNTYGNLQGFRVYYG